MHTERKTEEGEEEDRDWDGRTAWKATSGMQEQKETGGGGGKRTTEENGGN